MSIDILVIENGNAPPGAFLEVVLGCDRGIEAELARQRTRLSSGDGSRDVSSHLGKPGANRARK